MMETSTGETPKKMVFLYSFGEFWIIDRKLNAPSEGEKESASPPNPLIFGQLSVICCVQTGMNHKTLERHNTESGLPKQGWRLGLQEKPPAEKEKPQSSAGSPLPAALPAA